MGIDATPLRRREATTRDGVRLLRSPGDSWLDGGEQDVWTTLQGVTDRSALSDELGRRDETWELRYHFARERGNIVRGLDLPADARVLEIGAGCGAVTRELGERAALVDALEPSFSRARSAALRTADLEGVQVFAGELEDVPGEAAYDVVVIVGVLEYVGGRDGHDERVTFLRRAAALLRDGGTIACAIENRLGVQYFSGAPEDHLGRPFAGVEDYPASGPVRTFDRPGLERLFAEAGLTSETLGVFPDYKFARVVFGDGLLAGDAQALAWRAPHFPSRANPHPRAALASELHLWRSLVRAGLGGHFANSFLVVATKGGRSPLWPSDRLAAFWSVTRAAAYATQTYVAERADGITLERRRLADVQPPAGALRHEVSDSRWIAGDPILERLAEVPVDEFGPLLRAWRAHVEEVAVRDGAVNVDIGPHHVLLADAGTATIDEEWFDAEADLRSTLERGLLNTAMALTDLRPPELWPEGCATVGDVVRLLGRSAGLEVDDAAMQRMVDAEARLLARIATGEADPDPERVARFTTDVTAAVGRPLVSGALGPRATDHAQRVPQLEDEIRWLHAEVAARDRRVEELSERVRELDAALGDRTARLAADEPETARPPALLRAARRITRGR